MAIETKEILTYLGVPETEIHSIDSMDKLKEKFESSFIKRDMQTIKDDSVIYGQLFKTYNDSNKVALKRHAKENGIDLADVKLDDMHIGQALDAVLPKAFKGFTTQIETLKGEAGKGVDKKLTDLQAQFDLYKAEADKKIGGYDTLKNEFDTFKTLKETEFTEFKKGEQVSKTWDNFKWATGIDEFTKEGFMNRMNTKYKTSLDDKGELIVSNDKGERIKDETKAGAFKTLAEILEAEGMEANKKGARIFAIKNSPAPFSHPKQFQAKEETVPGANAPAERKINRTNRQVIA